MPSLDFCIQQALDANNISNETAEAINNANNPLDAINELTDQITRSKREAMIQAVRIGEGWARASSHPDGSAQGLMSQMVHDIKARAGYENIDRRQQYYEHRYHTVLTDFMNRFRPKKAGIAQDEAGMLQAMEALYGRTEGIDPEFVRLAKLYKQATDMAQQDFNNLGGDIKPNERWIAPQNHDARTIRKTNRGQSADARKQEWLGDVNKWIDPEYMTDDFGRRLSADDLAAGIEYTYQTITTDGLNKAKSFAAPIGLGQKFSRRGSQQRFLYFKDAESWTAYQNKYGRGDVYQTMMGGINMLANDSATMEIAGTDPRAWFDAMMIMVRKDTLAKTGKQLGAYSDLRLEAVFKTTTGLIDKGKFLTLADFGQTTRNIITSSKLGGAMLSAFGTDDIYSAITSNFNNLPPLKIMATKFKALSSPANLEELQTFASRIGFGAESWTNSITAGNRFGDMYMTGKSGKWAEFIMKASGLEPFTDAGRKAFNTEYAGYLADNFDLAYSDMNAKSLRAFEQYGITEADWDTFRASTPYTHDGATYANVMEPGGEKFHQMIITETDYAVPSPDGRVRSITTGGIGTGTPLGQVWRSATNLKSFAITLMTTHWHRAFYQTTSGDKATYFGALLAGSTIMGGLSLTMKDLKSGREPRQIDDAEDGLKFAGAAFLQGGGVGILGDYIFSDINRFGGGILSSPFGPTGQLLSDTFNVTWGNLQQKALGEETNFASEAVKYIDRNTPSLWQIQPIKSAMFEQIQMMVDPSAEKKMNQARKKRMKEYNQGYWRNPGEVLPN